MAMVKPKSISIASKSILIQCPHLRTFATFIVSIIPIKSKLTFHYILATVLVLHMSALMILSEEKQVWCNFSY